MENMTTKITSSYNNALDIKVVDGHFATNHSHINRYIDMTTIKSRRKMALAAAKSMATEYVATTIVDTIVCMDGTEVIGAYLANALTENGIVSMNQHQTIYIMTPEVHSSGQLIFRDNLQPMIKNKNVLLLLASATPARQSSRASNVLNTTVEASQEYQLSSQLQTRLQATRFTLCSARRISTTMLLIPLASALCVRPARR